MADSDVITQAYQDNLKSLFGVLFNSFVIAQDATTEKHLAEQRFLRGLALCREARDRAIDLVGSP